jgi:xanthine dehydrogenase accessory factor
VETSLGPLLPLFERERARGHALALGMLVEVAGSTYRKPGALMLIADNGEYSGLLSGGCLEGDLREHSRTVIASGTPRLVRYDTRGPDDLVWGLGLGCEGVMDILLLRCGPQNDWQPLTHLAAALAAYQATAIGVVVQSASEELPVGTLALPADPAATDAIPRGLSVLARAALTRSAADGRVARVEGPSWKLFVVPLSLPPRILLLGAGPDAMPVVEFAARLGWKVTLVDHRPAYAAAARFPQAERVLLARPESLPQLPDLSHFCAAIVMSHHLPTDLIYLRALADTHIPYVGLLGPAARREKLLADLGATGQSLRARLHAPVGLPLGGRSPESVALAIVAEVHAFVHQSAGDERVRAVPALPASVQA